MATDRISLYTEIVSALISSSKLIIVMSWSGYRMVSAQFVQWKNVIGLTSSDPCRIYYYSHAARRSKVWHLTTWTSSWYCLNRRVQHVWRNLLHTKSPQHSQCLEHLLHAAIRP